MYVMTMAGIQAKAARKAFSVSGRLLITKIVITYQRVGTDFAGD